MDFQAHLLGPLDQLAQHAGREGGQAEDDHTASNKHSEISEKFFQLAAGWESRHCCMRIETSCVLRACPSDPPAWPTCA